MRRTLAASGPWPLLFALWTLFVWGVRIKNADGSIGAVLLSLTFVVPAIAVLVLRGARGRALVPLLAGWTVLVWIVRIVDIVVVSDHAVGFQVVHAGLGAVSIGLAVAAARSVSRSAARPARA